MSDSIATQGRCLFVPMALNQEVIRWMNLSNDGKTYADIAKEIGVTKAVISRRVREGLSHEKKWADRVGIPLAKIDFNNVAEISNALWNSISLFGIGAVEDVGGMAASDLIHIPKVGDEALKAIAGFCKDNDVFFVDDYDEASRRRFPKHTPVNEFIESLLEARLSENFPLPAACAFSALKLVSRVAKAEDSGKSTITSMKLCHDHGEAKVEIGYEGFQGVSYELHG